MIIITLNTGYKLYYKGDIELQSDGIVIHVDSHNYDPEPDHLYVWDRKVFDILYMEDIESIVGKYDRIRVGNDGLIAEQYFAPGLTLRKQEKWKK
jgi:hypothetical protein